MQDGIFQGSHEQMMEEYTKRYKKVCVENNSIDGKLFDEFGVKRGLRDTEREYCQESQISLL